MKARLFFLLLIFQIFYVQAVLAEGVPLKIGYIGPLSGSYADYGIAVKNGIELYRTENPEKAPLIEFFYEDDLYDPKSAISAYRKLVDVNKVDLIFSFGGNSCLGLGPSINNDKKLLINFSADEEHAKNSEYIIRTIDYSGRYIKALLERLRKSQINNFAVANVETTYARTMRRSFERQLGANEKLLDLGSVVPGEIDFRGMLLKLKLSKIENVGLFLAPDQTLLFLKQGKDIGLKLSIFGSNILESALALPNSAILEGAIYPFNYLDKNFAERYRAIYPTTAQLPFAGNAYDITKLFYEIVTTLPGFDVTNFRESFLNVKDREGVLGNFSYVEDVDGGRYFSYPIAVKQVRDGVGVDLR